ncbi:MAG: hypothetical protein ABUL77_04335 [Bacteroidota bacterium]
MSAYPLKPVLDQRRRAERAAAAAAVDATRALQAGEQEEARRSRDAGEARGRWEQAAARATRAPGGGHGHGEPPPMPGEDLAAWGRFTARLRTEWKRAEASLGAYRAEILAPLRAAERAARDSALAAHQAVRALETHEAAVAEVAHRETERRADEAEEESARALHHARHADRQS